MGVPKEGPVPDRLQRKRVQNREAQQKYRSRVRERMSAMEKQIEELKSAPQIGHLNETQHQIPSPAMTDKSSKPLILPSIEGNRNDNNEIYSSKPRRLPNREDSFSEYERSRKTSFHQATPPTQPPFARPNRFSQGPIGTDTPQRSVETHLAMPYNATEPFPDFLWLPNSQANAPEPYGEVVNQCAIEDPTSVQEAKGGKSGHENDIPDSFLFEDMYNFQTRDPGPTRSPLTPSGTDLFDESHSFLALDMANEMLLKDASASVTDQARLTYAELKADLEGQSLEKRFEYIHLCLSAAGFHSFDSMASQYYTADFSHESVMSREQRISRQRQLAPLLAELRQHAETWTQWEAHGYCDEIIKSAESIIASERRDSTSATQPEYSKTMLELATPWQGADGGGNGMSTSALQPLMRMFQQKIPKLLAVVESLTNTSDMTNQRERFYTTIALMVLLNRPSKLSKWQMVKIMMTCLDMIYGGSK